MTHYLCIYEYEILNEFGILNKLVNLIKLTLQGSYGKMKIQGQLTEAFNIERGLRQSGTLPTILLNVVLEKVIRNIETNLDGMIV
jgi:hypothetical protein